MSQHYQHPDHFSKRARSRGYAARSVFKLEEIQEKTRFLRRGGRVLELGCYPGSWSRYVLEQVGAEGRLVGVDLRTPERLDFQVIECSIYELSAEQLLEALGAPPDAVISDMAPPTTGDRSGDHLRQIALAECALGIALQILKPGGSFLVKVFDGADAPGFQQELREHFEKVRRFKPKATRSNSREFFLLATGKRET